MNILHLTHSFLPVSENWVYSQLAHNTSCLSSVLCQYREHEAQFPCVAVYPRFAQNTFLTRLLSRIALRRGRYAPGHLQRVAGAVKPDLVHGHFGFVSCGHLRAVERCLLPLVTTFYGIDISKLPRQAVWQKRYAELFAYGSGFIVEGPHMADCLEKLGCTRDKITCIPIGIDLTLFSASPKKPFDHNRVRILFTGLSREKKGGLYAVSAFMGAAKNHPELHLDLIGTGRYLEPARLMLSRAGLFDRCTFHGNVPVARYRQILSTADIVLAPSVTAADGDTEGGAPVTVIEAQASGVPVVGTTHCDIPFIVRHGETGLLTGERDQTALNAHLEQLVADAPLREKMGAAAAIHAADQHDIRKQVKKISEVYRRCLL